MAIIAVQLLTDQGTHAVLKLPARKFPGVLVQGDTLLSWISSAKESVAALEAGSVSEGLVALRLLTQKMVEAQERYESALRTQGFGLPY